MTDKTTEHTDRNVRDTEPERPNAETLKAMLEAERLSNDPSVRRYADVDEALAELKRD